MAGQSGCVGGAVVRAARAWVEALETRTLLATVSLSGPATVDVGANYALTLSATTIGSNVVSGWSINWGDNTGVEAIPGNPSTANHVYTDGNNRYTISATATDTVGVSAPRTQVVSTTNGVNDAPVIGSVLLPVTFINEGQYVSLSVTFRDPDSADVDRLTIDWGDGSSPTSVQVGPGTNLPYGGTSSSPTVPGSVFGKFSASHIYTDDNPTATPQDDYTIRVTLTDPFGLSATADQTITVKNVVPTVNIGADRTGKEGDPFAFSPFVTDPSQVYSNWTGDTFTYAWTATDSLGQVIQTGTTPYFKFVAPDNDVYTVTATVTDDDGGVGTDSATVTTTNVAPTLTVTGPASVDEGSPYVLNLASTDPGADTISSWTIDWGDGVIDNAAGESTNAVHTYADGPNSRGITVTATDDDGQYTITGQAPTVIGLDPSFGDAQAKTPLAIVNQSFVSDPSLTLDRAGRTIVSGLLADGTWTVTRLLTTGKLDASFGTNGQVVIGTPALTGRPLSVAELANGTIVVAGTSRDGFSGNSVARVTRLTAAGEIDTTYGIGGATTFSNWVTTFGRFTCAKVLSNGNVLFGGTPAQVKGGVLKILSTGVVDTSFGNNGTGEFYYPSVTGEIGIRDMTLDANGSIYLGISATDPQVFRSVVYVCRLGSRGSFDQSFGSATTIPTDGFASFRPILPYVRGITLTSVAITTAQNVVIGGRSTDGVKFSAFTASFSYYGKLNTTYGTGGLNVFGYDSLASRVTLVPTADGGTFVGAGAVATFLTSAGASNLSIPSFVLTNLNSPTDTILNAALDSQSRLVMLAGNFDALFVTRANMMVTSSQPWTTVRNIAPVSNSQSYTSSVNEGATGGYITLDGLFDPSPVDTAAGFRFSYDFDGDGVFDLTKVTSPSVDVPDSYYADGPKTLNMKARVEDKDGGFTDYVLPMNVVNDAPTADLAQVGVASEGGTATVGFTNAFDFSPADASAGFLCSFDLDNDGVFEIARSTSAQVSWLVPDSGMYTVTGRITDKDGASRDYQTTVVVANVAPTATLAQIGFASEGGTATVGFSSASDASPADASAGFLCSFDLDNDGVFEIAPSTSAQVSWLVPDSGTYTVTGRITDKDGASRDYQATVVVANVAPTATPVVPAGAYSGAPVIFRLDSAFDPSPADAGAGFRYSFDFNDDGVYTGPGEVSLSTSPVAFYNFSPGLRKVRLRVTDVDGASSTYYGQVQVIAGASVSGMVYNDADASKTRGTDEARLSGRTVYIDSNNNALLDADEPFVVSQTDGSYALRALPPGTYVVRQVLPTGWTSTQGTRTVTLATGAASTGQNFGSVINNATISGLVFNDLNVSMARDSNEPGLAGRTVYIDANNNAIFDAGETSTLSLADGSYAIGNLPAGTFKVRQVVPVGFRDTRGVRTVTLARAATSTGQNFGSTTKALVSGSVFLDVNKNGVRDTGESAASSWRVFLDTNNNGVLNTAERSVLTDSSGNWSFADLAAGAYNVRVVLQSSYRLTSPVSGVFSISAGAGSVSAANVFGVVKI